MRHSRAVIAILGGLDAALLWATATLASARASRLIGASSTVAWAMAVGSALAIPAAVLSGPVPPTSASTLVWLAVAGFANVVGLLLVYRGLRIGKIGIVAALTSTEGAVTAVIAIIGGEQVTPAVGIMLFVVVLGVIAVSLASHDDSDTGHSAHSVDPAAAKRAAAFGIAAAVIFGFGLYGSAQVGIALPLPYAVLPARVVGLVVVFLPLLLTGRLLLTREALPLVIVVGTAEVIGTALFAVGARESIAVAAVLASQFAAVAAVAAFVVFRERLSAPQRAAVVAIAVSVAILTAVRG